MTFPNDIVRTARIHRSSGSWVAGGNGWCRGSAASSPNTRARATMPATFGRKATWATTPAGPPSYTSGA